MLQFRMPLCYKLAHLCWLLKYAWLSASLGEPLFVYCLVLFLEFVFFCRIMTKRGKPENSKNYGIILAADDQKTMQKNVSTRDTAPSRYPIDLPLQTLEILDEFWRLCNMGEGNGLIHMF